MTQRITEPEGWALIAKELGEEFHGVKLGGYWVIVRKDRRPITDRPIQSRSLPRAIRMVKDLQEGGHTP